MGVFGMYRLQASCIMAIVLSALASSSRAGELQPSFVGVAQSCDDTTLSDAKLVVPVVPRMKPFSGEFECVISRSRLNLEVVGIRTSEDEYQAGVVELTLTPQSQRLLAQVIARDFGRTMILLGRDGALLEFVVRETQRKKSLIISTTSKNQAELIANVLREQLRK